MPKYYGNRFTFDSASLLIVNNQSIITADVDLYYNGEMNGSLELTGRIISNTDLSTKKVSLLLLNQDKSAVLTHSSANPFDNNYRLTQLTGGTYYLQAIINGRPSGLKQVSVNNNMTVDIEIDDFTTAIIENRANEIQVLLYPNPSDGILNIYAGKDEISKVVIMDIQGKVMKVVTSISANQVNISDLNNGLYFVKVETRSGVFGMKKLRKE
jgi:hypothetical protein